MFTGNWPDIHVAALKERFADGMSFAQIAADINATFGTSYSRCACIGKATRIGLRTDKSRKSITPAVKGTTGRRPSRPTAPGVPPGTARAGVLGEGAEAAQPLNLTLDQLKKHNCRWPLGDGPYLFCGHPVFAGRPYCEVHMRLSRCGEPTPARRGHARPEYGEMLTRLKRKQTNSTRAILKMINTDEDLAETVSERAAHRGVAE